MGDTSVACPLLTTSALLNQFRFLRRFGRLAIANILSNLMVPLAGIIDTAFLGHLADIHHLGGVAIAQVIFNVVYWSFGFLRMGTTGLVAQAQGRQDPTEIALIIGRNGLVALLAGLIILGLQGLIGAIGFGLMSATPDIEMAGQAFYRARIWGAPAVLLNYVLLGWLLGQGQGRRVLVLAVVGNGSNILLDYLFIRQWGWASAGAGAATALSQVLMLAVALGYFWQQGMFAQVWQVSAKLWQPTAIATIFRLNRDILIRTFALVICFAMFTQWSAALGPEVLGANTLMLQVFTLAAYFIDGIAFATESITGQFYGAGQRHPLRWILLWGGSTSVILGLVFGGAFALWPRSLFGLMTDHEAILAPVSQYAIWLLPILGLGAIAFLLDGYFLGLTAGQRLRSSTLIAALGGFLPMALWARQVQSPHLLWAAMVMFMAVRALTLSWAVPATLRPQLK
ncbi:MAG: MATE family efflux transporter [Leptolyngbya sp. RL_3_1]|nr:MATE family efflux transporter [Leptolyngbya sp. RL_3_1]